MSVADEVRAAAATLMAAWGEHRRDDYFACFTEDATFIFHSTPERLESRAAYEALWDRWEREDGFRVLASSASEIEIHPVGDDVGIYVHDVDTTLGLHTGEEQLAERETIVFARRPDGRWLAVHEHLSPRP